MVEARSSKPLRVCDGCLAAVGVGGGAAAAPPAGGLAQPDLEPEPEPVLPPAPAAVPDLEPEPEPEPPPTAVAEAVPVLAVSRRTFATSNFKAAYGDAEVPGIFELGSILTDLIRGYCKKESIPWKEEGQPFLKKLQVRSPLSRC